MYINIVYFIIIFFPSYVYLCNYQLNNSSGTILLPPYDNNIECTWIFNLSLISNHIHFRSLLLTFHHFDTEYGHDELFIGETIPDVSKYNSKLFRFSGSKLPDPCLISLRASNLTRFIWMQFISDKTNTGSGFILDYVFLVNPSVTTRTKSPKLLINANIRHPLDNKSRNIQLSYPYPFGTISSPNYPQNYSDNIICRWNLYHQNAFIRLYIEKFHTELHYDTLTLYLGENLNNRAMILYELSGDDIENKHLFIPNDNLFLIFNTDKSNSASGFFLHYHIIEKEIYTINLYDNEGIIYSNNYPKFLRTNIEYTWNIQMNYSNEIEINLIDIHLDYDQDYLQVITGEIIYTLTSPEIFRVQSINETKIILRTKHSNDDYQYRGFKLTYQILNKTIEINNDLQNLPCGKTYSSHNGTIEFNYEITTIFDCLILIEVDDGQNIFLRFDHINWDNKENYIEIGLFHNPHQNQIFHISDTLPGTWFIANDSQIWIRFYSSQFSLDSSNFRLFYSETIGWSTITPDAYVQILDDNRLFPYRLISLPTNDIYHNLTQAYTWHIEALDDECIQIKFLSLQAFENRRICFHVKDSFKTSEICSTEQFPFIYHHIGSCILSIEPEFIWILVQYNIQIDKFKKITTINEVIFEENNMTLTPSNTLDSYVHIEWLITLNDSSMVIIDVENLDGNTPAKLFIIQDMNTTKSYSLGRISLTRFCHVILSSKSSFKIIYTSLSLPIHNSKRLFRLNLYKISKSYFNNRDFHYISYKKNQTNFQWSIQGQNEKSVFLAKLYSLHKNLSLQTTANVNVSKTNSFIYIPSSNFDVRYNIRNFDFILILYEQQKRNFYQQTILNKTSDLIGTSNFAFYNIHIQSTVFDSIDFIIMKADNGTYIRLYDLSVHNNGYFLLNSSSIITNKVSSLIGLRFSIKSLNIRIELQSLTKNPIQLRYKTQISSIQNKNSHHCLITNINLCSNINNNNNNNNETCNDSCSNIFDYISSSMNNTRINHFWPYALRGSVTLIIENTTIENFEKIIYRNLRHSIAKIIRQYCLNYESNCLSKDIDSIRADHVIVQSYEEELDDHRLYVAIFIKDPYRQSIALTNDQFLLALKRYEQEIYQDIKHHIHLPSNILEQSTLDPIWLYGVCLLALFILIVVLLILILILAKKTFYSTNQIHQNKRKDISDKKQIPDRTSLLISTPLQLAVEEDERISSTLYNETDSSQASNSTVTANLLPLPSTTTSCYDCPKDHTSYFNSNIETAIKQRLGSDDTDPIPFIDDNLSSARSRKSSACWSDRTSLSSRFSLVWKLNAMRSGSNNRSTLSNGNDKRRRYHHRTMRYTMSSSRQNQCRDEL